MASSSHDLPHPLVGYCGAGPRKGRYEPYAELQAHFFERLAQLPSRGLGSGIKRKPATGTGDSVMCVRTSR